MRSGRRRRSKPLDSCLGGFCLVPVFLGIENVLDRPSEQMSNPKKQAVSWGRNDRFRGH